MMANASQQADMRYLKGCRVDDIEVDGGLAYLHLTAPAANYTQAVVPVRIVEVRWVDDDPKGKAA